MKKILPKEHFLHGRIEKVKLAASAKKLCAALPLAAYGSLRPGQRNEFLLAGLPGCWSHGFTAGILRQRYGYPVLHQGQYRRMVPVMIFESPTLAAKWRVLDRFEGPSYQRTIIEVRTRHGKLRAYCYVAARSRPGAPSLP